MWLRHVYIEYDTCLNIERQTVILLHNNTHFRFFYVQRGKMRVVLELRNNISQTVILLLNNITVWSSDAGNYITRA
jgi:hypothetical protein